MERYRPGERAIILDDTSGLEAKSKDKALEKSTESTDQPQGWFNRIKSFGKNAWKRSEIFQTLEYHKAQKEFKQDNSPERQAEAKAITDRFGASAEFDEEFIHKAAGESKEQLGNSAAETEIKTRLQELIRSYARGNLDEGGFSQAKEAIFADIKGIKPEALGKGKMYADNLFSIARDAKEYVGRQVEQRIDQEIALANLDLDFEVVVGKAKAGVRTEAQFNAVDRIVDKIQRGTGGLFNEKTVAVGVAIANTFFSKVVQGSVRRAASAFGLGMAATGAAGALRESRKIEVERMQHAREKAQGKQVKNPDLAKRREELEASRIQTKSVQELGQGLKNSLFDKLAHKEAKNLTEAEYKEALKNLADINTRIQISDEGIVKNPKTSKLQFWRSNKQQRVDLIGYSDIAKVEKERNLLDILRASARLELQKWAAEYGHDLRTDLDAAKDGMRQELFAGDKGITKQNEVFHKLKSARVRKAFLKSALIGGAIGMAVQEAYAFASDSKEGLVEHGWHAIRGDNHPRAADEHVTLAEGIRRRALDYFGGDKSGAPDFSNLHKEVVGGHNFKLPDGFSMRPDGHGGYQIWDQGKAITGALHLNPDGTLDAGSKKYLDEHGFGSYTDTHLSKGPAHHLTLAETKAKFAGLDKHARVDWHDNPGKHYSSDHRSLIQFEGKQQNLYLEQASDGKVSVNANRVIKNLTENIQARFADPNFGLNPDGSFDQKLIHLRDQMQQWIKDGTLQDHMQVAIIPTEAANKAGLSALVEGAHGGKIALPKEYSDMFTNPAMLRDGKLPFKFMELRINGHVLATASGSGEFSTETSTIDTIIGKPGNPDFITEPPLIIPWNRRPGLEEMKRVRSNPDNIYGGYGRPREQMRQEYRERLSPTLRENPEAVLDFVREFEWYNENGIESDKGYTQSLTELLQQPGMRQPMAKECKAAVCIPVYSLGEGKGITHTLEQYRKQIASGSVKANEFEIILFLNHPKDKLTGDILSKLRNSKSRVLGGAPEAYDTQEVIRQYRKAHPEMNIRVMEKQFDTRPQWGVIIKHLYDAACARANGRKGILDKDLLILTNDADLRDMSDNYLRSFIDDLRKNEQEARAGSAVRVDGLVGRIDHDNEVYKKWPNFMLATRFDQFLDAQNRYGYKGTETNYDAATGYTFVNKITGEKQVITQGRSTAIRASAYCAVGGARTQKDAGADTEMGDMVREARRGLDGVLKPERNPFKYENKAWLETDPRRELGMYKQGRPIAWSWSDWDKMDVYGKSFAEQVEGDEEAINPNRLEREFEEIMKKWGVAPDSAEAKRALTWLGLEGFETNDDGEPIDAAGNVIVDKKDKSKYVRYKDYRIEGGKVKILRAEHLNKKLKNWRPKRERVI